MPIEAFLESDFCRVLSTDCLYGQFGTILDLALAQDRTDVVLDRALGQAELLTDLVVALAFDDQLQNFVLACGQDVVECPADRQPHQAQALEFVEDARGYARRQLRITAGDGADGLGRVVDLRILEQVGARAGASKIVSFISNMVSMMILVVGNSRRICLVAAIPSSRGMCTSISTTSGRYRRACSIAC
jgi:hypothetical protein